MATPSGPHTTASPSSVNDLARSCAAVAAIAGRSAYPHSWHGDALTLRQREDDLGGRDASEGRRSLLGDRMMRTS
jgi:hypothetical protein